MAYIDQPNLGLLCPLTGITGFVGTGTSAYVAAFLGPKSGNVWPWELTATLYLTGYATCFF